MEGFIDTSESFVSHEEGEDGKIIGIDESHEEKITFHIHIKTLREESKIFDELFRKATDEIYLYENVLDLHLLLECIYRGFHNSFGSLWSLKQKLSLYGIASKYKVHQVLKDIRKDLKFIINCKSAIPIYEAARQWKDVGLGKASLEHIVLHLEKLLDSHHFQLASATTVKDILARPHLFVSEEKLRTGIHTWWTISRYLADKKCKDLKEDLIVGFPLVTSNRKYSFRYNCSIRADVTEPEEMETLTPDFDPYW